MFLIGMIVLIGLWSVGFFLTFLFMCRLDFWALWTTARAIIDHCISDTNPNFSLAISDVITDVIILIIPIPLVGCLDKLASNTRLLTCRKDLAFESDPG